MYPQCTLDHLLSPFFPSSPLSSPPSPSVPLPLLPPPPPPPSQGYRQRDAFIITQAPMTSTTGDFWKMIWEQKSAAIVMLTELEEDGKVC